MNLLLLLFGARIWAGSPITMVTRFYYAISLFSLEAQLATWTGLATLRTLTVANSALAAVLFLSGHRRLLTDDVSEEQTLDGRTSLAILAALVLLLNLALPVRAADPYHLIRAERIERVGTLAYDADADPKLNLLGWLYELIVADVRAIPTVGPLALKFHGVAEVLLFAISIAAMLQILGVSSRLTWALLLVVPVVFHQFVLVKNDLFGAMPALIVLSWLIIRVRFATPVEIGWAAWLLGIAVGIKLTSFPLVLVAAGVLLLERRTLPVLCAVVAGTALGLVSAGVFFTFVENARVYGAAVAPFEVLGNRNSEIREGAVSIGRFFISLFDMGELTRRWWPGRGGWAGTYGLPLIWALVVLVLARGESMARRTLGLVTIYWVAFAAIYPDADIAHRLAIAPGLLAVGVAAKLVEEGAAPPWLRTAAIPVVVLSATQIMRSAALYIFNG